MLTIRESQMQILAAEPARQFEGQLERHLEKYFPHECRSGNTREFVRLGIERASLHGIDTQKDVALYLNLMAMLGCMFDVDPQIPWAGEQLDSPAAAPVSARVSGVYEWALAYLDNIGGKKCAYLLRAKLRLRKQNLNVLNECQPNMLPAELLAFLELIYPQKAQYQGEAAMKQLAMRAITSCQSRGAAVNRSIAIHAIHMFFIGIAYDQDPLYPWAMILEDTTEPSVDARFEKMFAQSLDFIESTLV